MVRALLAALDADDRPSRTLEIDGHAVALTRLDRVYWPADPALGTPAVTKRDLIRHLVAFSARMLPHLVDRPLTIFRWPEGILRRRVLQKHPETRIPAYVATARIFSDAKGRVVTVHLGELTGPQAKAIFDAIERVNRPAGADIDFDLSHAYWMSGLEPVDAAKGTARFDGTSLGLPRVPHDTFPEAGQQNGPAATGNGAPYTMEGQTWREDPGATPPTANEFDITLSGAKAVTLDLDRMKLSLDKPLTGKVTTDAPLQLTLHSESGKDELQFRSGSTSGAYATRAPRRAPSAVPTPRIRERR